MVDGMKIIFRAFVLALIPLAIGHAGLLRTGTGDPWLRGGPKLIYISTSTTSGSAATSIALVSGAHIGAGSADTDGFTTSAINTTGSTFLVAAVGFFLGGTMTFSDSKSNVWTASTTYTNESGNNSIRIYYSSSPVVGSNHTFTTTGSTNYSAITVQGFSGVHLTAPFDREHGSSGVGVDNYQPGNVAPSQDGELLISAYTQSAVAGTMTIDSGFTITDQVQVGSGAHFGAALAYKILGSGTSGVNVNPKWTNGGGVDQAAVVINTFKKAP